MIISNEAPRSSPSMVLYSLTSTESIQRGSSWWYSEKKIEPTVHRGIDIPSRWRMELGKCCPIFLRNLSPSCLLREKQ